MNEQDKTTNLRLTSRLPHTLRAEYNWLSENFEKVHIIIEVQEHDDALLRQYMDEKGFTTLNIAPQAVSGLTISQGEMTFNARFGGVSQHVVVPLRLIRTITGFNRAPNTPIVAIDIPKANFMEADTPQKEEKPESKRAHLRVVK